MLYELDLCSPERQEPRLYKYSSRNKQEAHLWTIWGEELLPYRQHGTDGERQAGQKQKWREKAKAIQLGKTEQGCEAAC